MPRRLAIAFTTVALSLGVVGACASAPPPDTPLEAVESPPGGPGRLGAAFYVEHGLGAGCAARTDRYVGAAFNALGAPPVAEPTPEEIKVVFDVVNKGVRSLEEFCESEGSDLVFSAVVVALSRDGDRLDDRAFLDAYLDGFCDAVTTSGGELTDEAAEICNRVDGQLLGLAQPGGGRTPSSTDR